MNKLLYTLLAMLSLVGLASCSESNDDAIDHEYDNWQARNEAFFEEQYQMVEEKAKADPEHWRVIKTYTKDPATAGQHADYVLVHVLGTVDELVKANPQLEGQSPMYTDSVRVYLRGYLMPSDSYRSASQSFGEVGRLIDATWAGDYNVQLMLPRQRAVSGFGSDGLTTVVQHMKLGERWEVCIPYQLGHGEAGTTSSVSSVPIPGYSAMIYDITLQNFAPRGKKMPTIQ